MSVATAQACAPGLQIRPRQLDLEAQALEQIALSLSRFTPEVVIQPDGLLLEVQASVRLFGGPLALWRQIQDRLQRLGVKAQMAAAPLPEAAWLLAALAGAPKTAAATRAPQPQDRPERLSVRRSLSLPRVFAALDALPLVPAMQVWSWSRSEIALVEGWGLQTLGELRAMPLAGLQRRLGQDRTQRLAQAYGLMPDPRLRWVAPDRFDQRLEWPERTDDLAQLILLLRHLLQSLEAWLTARGRAALSLQLQALQGRAGAEPEKDTVHTLRLAAPEWRADHLERLWREHWARLRLCAPVSVLRLILLADQAVSNETLALPALATGLPLPVNHDPSAFGQLVDLLQARLGPHSVRVLDRVDDHRPEWASVLRLPGDASPPRPMPSFSRRSTAAPRPVWLLHEPLPLSEHQGLPVHEGMVLTLRSRAERIEAGWFDGNGVCRDYHVAEGPDHRWRWVFRQRQGAEPGWFLHGWFA